jgi:hypothetical protein
LSSNISLGTDGNGNFSFFAPAGASQYSVCALSSSSTFTSCPANSNTVAIPNGVTTNTLSYGFKVGLVQDLAVAPGIVGSAMPGQIRPIFFSVINMFPTFGCVFTPTPNPGKVKYVLDKSFTYQNAISPTPAPNTIIAGPNGDTLVWNVTDFTTMASYQLYSISVQVSPSVSIGAPFVNYTIVQPLNDLVLSNNQAAFSFSIGIPCDPNNKLCYAQGIQSNGDIPFGTQDLYYTVNFQNIGTAPAINVKTLDTLDMNLDWTSLEVLSSSFPVQTQVDNSTGQTIFYFKNINLPDSTTNEAGSHGFVRYKIKLKPSIPVNTIIKNRAHNYFDYNLPVATNQTKNKLVNMVGIKELELSNSIKLQPNPVSDKLFIFCDEQIKEIVMLNSLGQPISRQEMNAKQAVIEMSNLPAGFYFVNIKTQSGSVLTKKIIKD